MSIPLDNIPAFLKGMQALHDNNKVIGTPGTYSAMLKHGRSFKDFVGHHSYPLGVPQMCFKNAAHLALNYHKELTYVEGYALKWVPIHHAWCIDKEGRIVDTTWGSKGDEYFGVPIHTQGLQSILLGTEHYGIFHSRRVIKYMEKEGLTWEGICL